MSDGLFKASWLAAPALTAKAFESLDFPSTLEPLPLPVAVSSTPLSAFV